jgi:hypothetical protein
MSGQNMSGLNRTVLRRTGMVVAALVMATGLTSCLLPAPPGWREDEGRRHRRYDRHNHHHRRYDYRRGPGGWRLQPDSFTVTHEVPNTR